MGNWRGSEALNNDDLAGEFWKQVGEQADPDELKVGDVVTLEITKGGKVFQHRLVRVVRCMKSPKGERQIQFEDVPSGETVVHSGVVLVVPL